VADPHADSRTYDVDLLRGPGGSRTGPQLAAPADASGSWSVTGVEKLAQRVVLELLTRRGSMPLLPSRGSSLLDAVAGGLVRTEVDVHQRFAFAAVEVERNLAADASPADPPDERLARLELARATVAPGRLTLDVRIETAAGTGIEVPAVIPTSP